MYFFIGFYAYEVYYFLTSHHRDTTFNCYEILETFQTLVAVYQQIIIVHCWVARIVRYLLWEIIL